MQSGMKTKCFLFICYAPSIFSSLCCSMFSTCISPISFSLCAWVSNELVWFHFPATGIFSIPSPSPSHSPLLICYLAFFSQCLFSPKVFPGCFFLLSSALTLFLPPSLKNFNCIPMVLERIQHAALPRASSRSC